MVDTFGMTGMIVLALLVLAAIYIFIRLIGKPKWSDGEEGDEEEPDEAEVKPAIPLVEKRQEMSDEEFIESYTGPMMDDALDTLEAAVDSAGSGLEYYRRSVWEAAGEEFHSAARDIDHASSRLKEIVSMVENQGSKPSRQANARVEECRKLRALTIRMEEACDARVEGKDGEAKQLDIVMPELERLVTAFKK